MEDIMIDNGKLNEYSLKWYVLATVWIFLGFYALVKAIQILDRYLTSGLLGNYKSRSKKRNWEQLCKLYQEMKMENASQFEELHQRDTKLECLLTDLEESNRQLFKEKHNPQSANDDKQMEQEPKNAYPNLFIKNNHFHMTNQMFVKEAHFDLNIKTPSLPPKVAPSTWGKYLKQRKSLMSSQSIVDCNSMIENTPGRTEPPILSTEQMEIMQGMGCSA